MSAQGYCLHELSIWKVSATPEAPHHPLGPATTQWKTELTQTLTSRLGSEGSRRGRANQSPAEHPQPTPRGGGRMFGHHLYHLTATSCQGMSGLGKTIKDGSNPSFTV